MTSVSRWLFRRLCAHPFTVQLIEANGSHRITCIRCGKKW